MLKQMEVFLIAAVFVLITAIVLIINTWQRADEFKQNNKSTQQAIVKGAVYAINNHLLNRHRHVQLFLDEYEQLILHLQRFPSDEQTENDIRHRLQQRFPDFFTFTITDQKGKPVLQDVETLVGEVCQLNLEKFVQTVKTSTKKINNKVFIHPQPFNYHYDIMTPMYMSSSSDINATMRGESNIFFASFYPKEIADILKTHEIPGQKLILVKQPDATLIEIAQQGARDKLSRDISLTKEEQDRIRIRENIPNSDWQLINLPNDNYEKAYLRKLWTETIIIMFIVAFALFLLIVVLIKTLERRTTN